MTVRKTILLPALLLAAGLAALPAAAQQAGLTAETWTNLTPGKSILILRDKGISQRTADFTALVTQAQISGLAASSGTRLRGTITPMATDSYTFWVNGSTNVALWISADGTRFDKEPIAWNLAPTTAAEWSKHPDQRSVPILLQAGTSYHIEAHVMSGAANGHLAIAWQGQKGNWALAANGATATQSTTQWEAHASRANDGNTSGIWANGEPTQTTNQQNSWLKVDFAATRPVNQIVLFNNAQNQNRLSNFRISALDASGAALAQQDFFTTSGNVGNSLTWDMPSVVEAAAVKIELLGNNLAGNGTLSLAEVQAFHATPPPANWALASSGSTATQSSTSGTSTASLANDGNPATASLTADLPGSSLEIDFGQDRPVNRVTLRNNPENPSRLSNFRISLLDATDAILASGDHFTATGHAGSVHYWNLVSSVQARKIRVELLGQNRDGNGYLSLAEVQAYEIDPLRETRDFQVIPAAYLTSVGSDPDDANDNNLPDAWEQSTGLSASALPGALLEHGDPDNDGISNYDEHRFGGNPLAADGLGDGLTRDIWTELTGIDVASMTANRARFLAHPNQTAHLPGIDGTLGRKDYGVRYRGSFIAPSSGIYRFWIAGNGDARLWLSDGTVKHPVTGQALTSRFGKQHLATSGPTTAVHDFDSSASQRSRAVVLTQGEHYYIEVLHKQPQSAIDHVSVAWQPPGQARAIMPAAAFLALAPDANDADDDNLPDDWETANGLNPADNGLSSAANGEYGDPDGDGLTNLQEFQNGTKPKVGDTDFDGISDADEIRFYGSDPLVSNNLSPVVVDLPPVNQYSASTGIWTADPGGSLSASGRRGGIIYTFEVSEPGIHEVAVAAGAISATSWYTKYLNLVLSLDDAPFAKGTLSSRYGATATLRTLTPWLAAGTHTLTIFHDNVAADLRLRLDSVSAKRLGGTDLDADGIPDWVAAAQAQANRLTRISSQSRTSPLSVEGLTQQLSSAALSALMPGAQEADAIPATESINDTFFAEVPLSAEGDVTLSAGFLGGAVTESHGISWIATNLFEFDQAALHIRMGDSLRLDAWGGAAADGQPFTVTLNSTLIEDGNQNTTHTSGQPLAVAFPAAGTHTLVATHGGQTATVTLHVHSADFGPGHAVRVGVPRAWAPPVLAADAIVEADDDLTLAETTATGSRTFHVGTGEAADNYAIARLPDGIEGAPSAILARGEILGFDTAQVDETRDARTVVQYPDGTWLMHSTVVAANLPEGVVIRLTAKNQGTLFADGSTVLELRASDFDSNGIAHIYFEWSGEGDPKMCHTTSLLIEP